MPRARTTTPEAMARLIVTLSRRRRGQTVELRPLRLRLRVPPPPRAEPIRRRAAAAPRAPAATGNRSARSADFRAASVRGSHLSQRRASARRISSGRPSGRTPRRVASATRRSSRLLQPRDAIRPMWSRWNLSGASRAVGRNGAALRGADADREHRDLLARGAPAIAASRSPSPLSPSLTISTARWPRSPSCSNTLRPRGERRGDVGGGIAEVVGARRVEEEPKRRPIGGERQLEKRAAAEHHEPDPVARRGRHRLPRRAAWPPRGGCSGDSDRSDVVIERERSSSTQHVASGARQLALPLAELRPREGEHAREPSAPSRQRPRRRASGASGRARARARAARARRTAPAPPGARARPAPPARPAAGEEHSASRQSARGRRSSWRASRQGPKPAGAQQRSRAASSSSAGARSQGYSSR